MPEHRRVLFLANVGNRDLYLDGRPLADQHRARGKEILADYAAHKDRLQAPILEAALQRVLREGSAERPLLITVGLFGTDQSPSAGQHYERDTEPLARVLAKYLPERFPPQQRGVHGHVDKDVRVRPIRENPSYYDEMYDWFGPELARVDPTRFEQCYVSPVGGTPAANFALLLRAIERFERRCQVLYVPEGKREPVVLNIADHLVRRVVRARAHEAIERYEFARAAELLREVDEPVLVALAEHAAHRLHFDFEQARAALDAPATQAARGERRELLRQLNEGLDALVQGESRALVAELYYNLLVTHAQGRYVDFLARLFRLHEALLRLLVEETLGLPTDEEKRRAHPRYTAGIEQNAALKAFLDQRSERGVFDATRPPNRWALEQLATYAVQQAGVGAPWPELAQALKRIQGLADLRNKSIGGHGFCGVSRGRLECEYRGDLLADLAAMMALLDVSADASPFEQVRRALLAAGP
jgi:hypothetical protein